MQNFTAVLCRRCGKEIKRLTVSMILRRGNPDYCDSCNESVQELPN